MTSLNGSPVLLFHSNKHFDLKSKTDLLLELSSFGTHAYRLYAVISFFEEYHIDFVENQFPNFKNLTLVAYRSDSWVRLFQIEEKKNNTRLLDKSHLNFVHDSDDIDISFKEDQIINTKFHVLTEIGRIISLSFHGDCRIEEIYAKVMKSYEMERLFIKKHGKLYLIPPDYPKSFKELTAVYGTEYWLIPCGVNSPESVAKVKVNFISSNCSKLKRKRLMLKLKC
jgi:hypothetical protein